MTKKSLSIATPYTDKALWDHKATERQIAFLEEQEEKKRQRRIEKGQKVMSSQCHIRQDGPGSVFMMEPDVAYYRIDEDKPGCIIRTLNGKEETGRWNSATQQWAPETP